MHLQAARCPYLEGMDEAVVSEVVLSPGEARMRVLTWLTGRSVVVWGGVKIALWLPTLTPTASVIPMIFHMAIPIITVAISYFGGWTLVVLWWVDQPIIKLIKQLSYIHVSELLGNII